jgi:hypothetical protein
MFTDTIANRPKCKYHQPEACDSKDTSKALLFRHPLPPLWLVRWDSKQNRWERAIVGKILIAELIRFIIDGNVDGYTVAKAIGGIKVANKALWDRLG